MRADGRRGSATTSASANDGEAHWVKHKGKPALHGFKAHVGADAETALVEEIAVTPANVNDGKAGPAALPDKPGEVFADSAYRGSHFGDAVRARLFTELGNGALDVAGVVRALDHIGFDGWLMVQQDSTWLAPSEAAAAGGRVLRHAIRELAR